MNILYALLISLITYTLIGTILFWLVEKLNVPVKLKVLIITLGHPLSTGILLWFSVSVFSESIAQYSVLFVCGSLLRVPFSDVKYFVDLVEDSGTVTIEYFSESILKKKVQFASSDIKKVSQSKGGNIFDKPSVLIISLPNRSLTFKLLSRQTFKLPQQ